MEVDVKQVAKSFKGKSILENISFHLHAGDRLAIIGKSGEGKSVLFRMLCGLSEPDHGTIHIKNLPVYPISDTLTSLMGVVFQFPALIDTLNVWENIAIRDIYHQQPIDLALQKALLLLSKVGLTQNDARKKIDELSGGMKKRVAIARALFHNPPLLLLDEPHTGLDPLNAQLIDQLLINLFLPHHIFIFVTHNLPSLNVIANKVLFIHQAQGLFFESIDSFLQSQHPIIQAFREAYT